MSRGSQVSQEVIPSVAAGWRGVVGEDITFARVRVAAGAMARAVRAKRKNSKLLVAYDTRFFSMEFARAAANVLESEGVHALLTDRPTPAPAVSFEILRRKLAGGIYISAGRDSAEYNGLSFFDADGAAAGRERLGEIERLAAEERDSGRAERAEIETPDFEMIDPSPAYLESISKLVRFDHIRRAGLVVAYDAMHGASAGWLDRLLVAEGVQFYVLNENRDVLFDGRCPDPEPGNLKMLASVVRESGAALGLATGGAGRHFGVLDGQGRFIDGGHIFALVYDYLIESRGWRLGAGIAGQTPTSRPDLVEGVARRHRLPVYQIPAGSGKFAALLKRDQVAAGIDEEGGITIRGHVPEGDGILGCLLVAEMVAERGGLDEQLQILLRHAGADL